MEEERHPLPSAPRRQSLLPALLGALHKINCGRRPLKVAVNCRPADCVDGNLLGFSPSGAYHGSPRGRRGRAPRCHVANLCFRLALLEPATPCTVQATVACWGPIFPVLDCDSCSGQAAKQTGNQQGQTEGPSLPSGVPCTRHWTPDARSYTPATGHAGGAHAWAFVKLAWASHYLHQHEPGPS